MLFMVGWKWNPTEVGHGYGQIITGTIWKGRGLFYYCTWE